MKSSGSIGNLLWALLLLLLAFICTGNSFQQELWLYDAQDNAIQFHTPVADTSHLSSFLPYVTRGCARGYWYLYRQANFLTYKTEFGSRASSGIFCSEFTSAAFVKSLRHLGANDTDTQALSLYEGSFASGEEIVVTARAHTGITNKIIGIAITGTSDWMLFEGQELDGNSTCYKIPSGNFIYYAGVDPVGSVFKGCDAQKIQNYKLHHKSSFANSN